MGTVFGKNTTSASITVAGHKVYYIDSTDAEIVEVEGQGGGGSTASDDATGAISGVTLPTAHSYTGVSFDSLRYYAKGTLSNTGYIDGTAFGQYGRWFYGTLTWEDATLGDLTSKITTNSASSSVLLKQQYFRIIFIYDGAISGAHPSDTSESTGNQITEYSYNDGVHSIRFYAQSSNWYNGQSSGRIQFRYLDGTTTFQNLSAFDLVNVSGGSLSKATATDRYDMYNAWGGNITLHALYGSGETIRRNAFKYTLSGTPYWYVIDGEHDTWTDDLSAWGYSEVPVGPVLPEVKQVKASGNGWGYLVSNLSDTSVSIANNEKASLYFTANTNVWGSSSLPYSVGMLQSPSGTDIGTQGVIIDTSENVVKCKNVSGSSLSITRMTVYYCNDSTATVITVYNSSNVAYNAFKFTANSTDYYYVLDGTQTDWTDDLSGIGYRDYIEATYYYYDKSYTNVSNNSWVYLYDNGTTTIPVDDVSKYEFVKYYTGATDTTGRDYGITLSVYNGKLTAKNTSGATIALQRVDVRIHSL